MRKEKQKHSMPKYIDENAEWLSLTPSQRILETTKLWQLYISLGGNLDPEPDPQSPFYSIYGFGKKKFRNAKKT